MVGSAGLEPATSCL